MEESRRVFKFEGEADEYFHLWMARTEAALQDKEAWSVVETDVFGTSSETNTLSENSKKTIAKARAVIMQGLGDNPLRLCLQERGNPDSMWKLLKDRYDVVNVATKVQLHYQLARLSYSNQTMSIYIDQFQTIFNKQAGIGSLLDEDTKVATLLASFGDNSESPYGQLVTALQTGENSVSWNTATARLLQEFHEKSMSATTVGDRNGGSSMALNTRQRKRFYTAIFENTAKWKKKIERRRCFECKEVGHIAR